MKNAIALLIFYIVPEIIICHGNDTERLRQNSYFRNPILEVAENFIQKFISDLNSMKRDDHKIDLVTSIKVKKGNFDWSSYGRYENGVNKKIGKWTDLSRKTRNPKLYLQDLKPSLLFPVHFLRFKITSEQDIAQKSLPLHTSVKPVENFSDAAYNPQFKTGYMYNDEKSRGKYIVKGGDIRHQLDTASRPSLDKTFRQKKRIFSAKIKENRVKTSTILVLYGFALLCACGIVFILRKIKKVRNELQEYSQHTYLPIATCHEKSKRDGPGDLENQCSYFKTEQKRSSVYNGVRNGDILTDTSESIFLLDQHHLDSNQLAQLTPFLQESPIFRSSPSGCVAPKIHRNTEKGHIAYIMV